MAKDFLKLVSGAAAEIEKSQRQALDFKVKAGTRTILRGFTDFAASVVDSDPADFVDSDSTLLPINKLSPQLRRLCEYQLNDEGQLVAMPPSLAAKLNFMKLGVQTLESARAQGILINDKEGEQDVIEPFIVQVHPVQDKSEGAKMIEDARQGAATDYDDLDYQDKNG